VKQLKDKWFSSTADKTAKQNEPKDYQSFLSNFTKLKVSPSARIVQEKLEKKFFANRLLQEDEKITRSGSQSRSLFIFGRQNFIRKLLFRIAESKMYELTQNMAFLPEQGLVWQFQGLRSAHYNGEYGFPGYR
jgi:hypothetical protein